MDFGLRAFRLSESIVVNSLVTYFYNEFSENYFFHGEKHNFWEIVYIDKGKAIVTANDKTFELPHGSMVFHKPNEFHAIRADKNSPPNVLVITFTTSSPSMAYFEGLSTVVPKESRYHIHEIIENHRHTFERYDGKTGHVKLKSPIFGGEQMIKTHLEQLFIELIRTSSGNAFSSSRMIIDNKTVDDCISILEENVRGKITIDGLCSKTNYSRAYLCTLFRNKTGKSVIEYYNELKIEEAKELIRKGSYTVSEISDILSFSTPNYFSLVFKKITHMTPGEYKESLL